MSFCNVPEHALAIAGSSSWRRGYVLRHLVESKPDEFTDQEYKELIDATLALWTSASGLRTERVTSSPNLVFKTRRIDGAGGILAEAQLPPPDAGPNVILSCWMDVGEQWVNATNPAGRMMDAYRVLGHEEGHLFGLGHESRGRALMNPTISEIRSLTDLDIEEIVRRYGDPSTTPPPGGETPCEALLRGLPCLETEASQKTMMKAWELAKKAMGMRE